MTSTYLPAGLPPPAIDADGLSQPYWNGLREEKLLVQRCRQCRTWQFGPEWICHHCLSFDLEWAAVEPRGRIYSWVRIWHPVHSALADRGPYLVVLVELPHAGKVRMLGNLLGDAMQQVTIGAEVLGVFEHHHEHHDEHQGAGASAPYSLLHWRSA